MKHRFFYAGTFCLLLACSVPPTEHPVLQQAFIAHEEAIQYNDTLMDLWDLWVPLSEELSVIPDSLSHHLPDSLLEVRATVFSQMDQIAADWKSWKSALISVPGYESIESSANMSPHTDVRSTSEVQGMEAVQILEIQEQLRDQQMWMTRKARVNLAVGQELKQHIYSRLFARELAHN